MKFLIVFLTMSLGLQAYSQSQLNEYKYIIVPKKFDGFRNENQYQTSTAIKFYFVQRGFNAVYEDALPQDLNNDRCLGLLTSLFEDSSMFATRVNIVLKDCNGKEVYRTLQGISKEKEYNAAYREAISEAFISLNGFNYAYKPKAPIEEPLTISFKDDVKNLDLEEKVEEGPVLPQQDKADLDTPKDILEDKELAEPKSEAPEELIKEDLPLVKPEVAISQDEEDQALYAQKTAIGYQLVDTTPSIQYYLKETSMNNVFLAEGEKHSGLLYKVDNQWVFEYYEGSRRVKKTLEIKF